MTHTRQYADDEGTFSVAGNSPRPCRVCGTADTVTYKVWTSHDEAYEDYKYTCSACGAVWWIDGIDS